jgi:Flp pilus assembly protein TadD
MSVLPPQQETPTPGEIAPLLARLRAAEHAQLESQARELLLRYPAAGFVWKVLGVSLWAQRKDSLPAMERAAALLPRDAEAHINLGNARRACGRLRDAAASYRAALEIRPEDADTLDRLGSTLHELGEIDEAASCCRRALALRPQSAELHSNLAMLLLLKNRPAEAQECCRRSLELNPALTGSLVMLAELEAASGEFARAEALLRRAISLEPDMPEAWAALGRSSASRGDGAWLSEVQRLLGRPMPARREIPLRYALGRYCDEVGEFSEAFSHYRRANELARLHSPPYDRLELARQVDTLIRTHGRPWLEEAVAAGHASRRPVLIIGMWRSGTTLAEQILASHPAVYGAGELGFWTAAAARYGQGSPLAELADQYLALLDGLSPPAAERVVDKMPANFLHLGLIHAALPQARIIHMRRDPLDTCLSIYFQDFTHGHPYAHDLADIAHYYRQYLRLMEHWRSTVSAGAMLEVPYEDLVESQEACSRRMLDFIGLPWDPRCLDFHRTPRTVTTFSKWQVRQPINRSSLRRWRNYASYIAPLLPLADQP